MPIYVELRDASGSVLRELADPNGGTFDSAGDFDRFVDQYPYEPTGGLRMIASVDSYGDTRMPAEVMGRLIADVVSALEIARPGPEQRGLLRLRVMAERCSKEPGSALHWIGD